jgi:hypothetical protein
MYILYEGLMVLKNIYSFLWRKLSIKILLSSLKTFTISKMPFRTLFIELVGAFRKPPVLLKIVPKANLKCSQDKIAN